MVANVQKHHAYVALLTLQIGEFGEEGVVELQQELRPIQIETGGRDLV